MEKGEGIEKEGERHVFFFLRYVRTLGEGGGGGGAGGTI